MALMALTEPRTHWRRITWFALPRWWVALQTYLLSFAPGKWWRICTIRTTRVLHSSQVLWTYCSRLHNAWQCLCLCSADTNMPHSPHICLALRFCHVLKYSLRLESITCHCICFPIIVFYMSEIYCPIFTLSSTMSWVLHILHWSIIGLQWFCLFIWICIVAILKLIPVDITGSRAKPTMPSVLHILHWFIFGLRCFFLLICIHILAILALILIDIVSSQVESLEFLRRPLLLTRGGDGIALMAFFSFIYVIRTAPWHPEMQFIINAIVRYRDVCVSASDLGLLKRHFRGQIVKNNRIVNTCCFHADDHSRCWVLHVLDLTLDGSNSAFIHPLLVALR